MDRWSIYYHLFGFLTYTPRLLTQVAYSHIFSYSRLLFHHSHVYLVSSVPHTATYGPYTTFSSARLCLRFIIFLPFTCSRFVHIWILPLLPPFQEPPPPGPHSPSRFSFCTLHGLPSLQFSPFSRSDQHVIHGFPQHCRRFTNARWDAYAFTMPAPGGCSTVGLRRDHHGGYTAYTCLFA